MGRIEGAPSWILKYKSGIEKGILKMEDILEIENKIREKPIRLATVSRAINAMGYTIVGLRKEEGKRRVKKEGEEKGKIPDWILKYKSGIERGILKAEDILKMENEIREKPIDITTVNEAISAAGYRVAEGVEEKEEVREEGVVYTGSIGGISRDTERRYMELKRSWEEDLGKSLHNDYFLNILLALAKLVRYKKTLRMK
ncbi:MAG: hypothetical protein ACXQTS_03470 [Candidatus Methanospirareceae archaeon]